jgi:hypothetical protein
MSLLRKVHSSQDLNSLSKYERISYRQKGGELKGSLYIGCTHNAFSKRSIGSIPSKYETILHPQKENGRKGFGSNAFRFTESENENPGPGQYPIAETVTSIPPHSDSYSKKGYGNGFVSRNQRFRIENYHPFQVPGPGSYAPVPLAQSKSQLFDAMSLNKSKILASTAHGSFGSNVQRNKIPKILKSPGPGAYNVTNNLLSVEGTQSVASFKSSTKRFQQFNPKNDVPSPGQYETDIEAVKRIISQSHNPTASFKLPSTSKRVKVNLYDPFSNVESEEKITPGPGTYVDAHYSITKQGTDKLKVGKTSSMFARPNMVDRFGKLVFPHFAVPGPGTYDDKLYFSHMEKIKKPLSSFQSSTKRPLLGNKANPGPAFYKLTNCISRESLNVNPKKDWL